MGYCPFLALGHDPGTVSRPRRLGLAGGRASARQIGSCARNSACDMAWVSSQPGAGETVSRHTFWCRDMVGLHGFMTHSLASRQGSCREGHRCRDTLFGTVTWVRQFGVKTHFLVSRHGLVFWCRDLSLWGRNWLGRLGAQRAATRPCARATHCDRAPGARNSVCLHAPCACSARALFT